MTIPKPKLRLTAYTWAKIIAMRDFGDTEVGGWGFSGYEDNPMILTDFSLVKQECSTAFVELDDQAYYEYFTDMTEQGFTPNMFNRIWIHTHPGSSPTPSSYDDSFFKRVTDVNDFEWAIMFIIARDGSTYARLKMNTILGPIETPMDVVVDWKLPFEKSENSEWKKEYEECVTKKTWASSTWNNNKASNKKSNYNKNSNAAGFKGHMPSNAVPIPEPHATAKEWENWLEQEGMYYGGNYDAYNQQLFDDGVSGFAPDPEDDDNIIDAEIIANSGETTLEDYVGIDIIDATDKEMYNIQACWSLDQEIQELSKKDQKSICDSLGIKLKEAGDYMYFINDEGLGRVVKTSILIAFENQDEDKLKEITQ